MPRSFRVLIPGRFVWIGLLAAIVLVPVQAAQSQKSDRLERAFVSAGRIHLDLSAGAYEITGSPENAIRIRWRTADPDDMRRVRATVDVRGSEARIATDGPGNNFRVDIEVPQRSDLVLRLSAGDLQVRRIEGSKDIDIWAGDVTVEVGDPARYKRVSASVRAGEITASPFKVSKGGLMRAFNADGNGPYELRVKLFAGDLKLVR